MRKRQTIETRGGRGSLYGLSVVLDERTDRISVSDRPSNVLMLLQLEPGS